MVRGEMTESVKGAADEQVEERLLDYLLPRPETSPSEEEDGASKKNRTREKLREQLRAGALDDRPVEIAIEEKSTAIGVFGQAGMEMDVEFQTMVEKMLPSKRETRRMAVKEARKVLFAQEAEKLVDREKIHRTAIERVEQSGIVFLDELDKIAGTDSKHGPDVSRQGVQRDLLPIVEGSAVTTRYGIVRTDYILFIAAGAFHASKPSDLMPELQGRFPIRVELQDLTKDDFVRILHEPQNSLIKQQVALMGTEGVDVEFSEDAIDAMAQIAYDLNRRTQNIGARRLYTILERVVEKLSFEGSDSREKTIEIDAAYVRERLKDVLGDEDLSKFIL
jgi:ATP-dependent HslUV protease ATP-binding subunit HslU